MKYKLDCTDGFKSYSVEDLEKASKLKCYQIGLLEGKSPDDGKYSWSTAAPKFWKFNLREILAWKKLVERMQGQMRKEIWRRKPALIERRANPR